jgi:hypothetical protein
MQDQSNYGARVVFNCGTSNSDVFIDNVSLKEIVESVVEEDDYVQSLDFKLVGNHPNPFNPNTTICYAVPHRSDIKITIYNILGEEVEKSIYHNKNPGIHETIFSATSLSSGIYFCLMEARSNSAPFKFIDVLKMIVIK